MYPKQAISVQYRQLSQVRKRNRARSRPTITSNYVRSKDVRSDIVIARHVRARIVLEKVDSFSSGGDQGFTGEEIGRVLDRAINNLDSIRMWDIMRCQLGRSSISKVEDREGLN